MKERFRELSQRYYVKKMWHQGQWFWSESNMRIFHLIAKIFNEFFFFCPPHLIHFHLRLLSVLQAKSHSLSISFYPWTVEYLTLCNEGSGCKKNSEFITKMTSIWLWDELKCCHWNLHFIFDLSSSSLWLLFLLNVLQVKRQFCAGESEMTSYHQSNESHSVTFHVKMMLDVLYSSSSIVKLNFSELIWRMLLGVWHVKMTNILLGKFDFNSHSQRVEILFCIFSFFLIKVTSYRPRLMGWREKSRHFSLSFHEEESQTG